MGFSRRGIRLKLIELTKGYQTTVDDEDYNRLSSIKWKARISGHRIYALRNKYVKGKYITVYMHREILNIKNSKKHIDHIDGNSLNNCKNNLRIVSSKENTYNRQANISSTSKYKGVSWNKNVEKWIAQIQINKKKIHLGCYIREIDAALAYNNAAIKYYGQYAWLNQIKEKI